MKMHHKLSALFLVFLLGVVGCNRGKEPPTTSEAPTTSELTSTSGDSTSEGPSTEIVATKLEAPEVCVDNVLDIFYYEGVENASGYKLKLVDVEDDTNLVEKPFTSDDSLLPILSELEIGTYEQYYGTDEVPYTPGDAKDAYLIKEGTTINVTTNKYGGQIEGNEWGTRNEQRELVTVDSFAGNLFTLSTNGDNYTYEEAIETEKVYLTTHFKLDGVELSEHLARLLTYSEVIEEYYDPLYEKYFINTYGPFLDIVWNGTSHTGRFKKALEFNCSSDGITFEVTYSFVKGTGESESRVFYESYTTGTVTYP